MLLLTVAPFSDMCLKEGFRNMSGCDGVKSGKFCAGVLNWKVFFTAGVLLRADRVQSSTCSQIKFLTA